MKVLSILYFLAGWSTRENYLNSTIKNYAEPLLNFLDLCQDSAITAYYLIIVTLSGRLSFTSKEKALSRIYRARNIYQSLNMNEAVEFTKIDLLNENVFYPLSDIEKRFLGGNS